MVRPVSSDGAKWPAPPAVWSHVPAHACDPTPQVLTPTCSVQCPGIPLGLTWPERMNAPTPLPGRGQRAKVLEGAGAGCWGECVPHPAVGLAQAALLHWWQCGRVRASECTMAFRDACAGRW